ncbi:MAG: hypothetical protein A2341_11940 [Deltaproteobacteria bacterium RIFOXYB12_FULL_58_9]|nr:MAG: hypothetical protein A2341_11940 [Deltaproteobacteria bacterium RIFOXYB12_FULL_58_9]
MELVDKYPGFLLEDLREGNGRGASQGDRLSVRYTGWLEGQRAIEFPGGNESTFVLGNRHVIEGWDLGLVGLKVGGLRRLVVPPNLGYRSRGVPELNIPKNATLVFEIELLKIC